MGEYLVDSPCKWNRKECERVTAQQVSESEKSLDERTVSPGAVRELV